MKLATFAVTITAAVLAGCTSTPTPSSAQSAATPNTTAKQAPAVASPAPAWASGTGRMAD